MSNFSSPTTWDGKPISAKPPYGVAIIVYRRVQNNYEFLILHRSYHGPNYEGEWAWTPPSGARQPGESIRTCAQRELREETGLHAIPELTAVGSPDWSVFMAEVSPDAQVHLDQEHDRFAWLTLHEAVARCQPRQVGDPIKAAGSLLGLPTP